MVNDISILSGIIIFFIAVGVALPFVNGAFGNEQTTSLNVDSFVGNVTYKATDINDEGDGGWFSYPVGVLNAFKVLASIIAMFFWSFQVPYFVELLIFMPLRLVLVFIIARNIWIGGGG